MPIAVPRETSAASCARALRAAILSGELPPGMRLPSERELSKTLGVTRVTLRPALFSLQAEGLLTVRHGSGHVVRDFRREGAPGLIADLLALAKGPAAVAALVEDLLLVRRQLARAALEKLKAAATRKGLAAVASAVDRLEAAASAGEDALAIARADLEVMAALAEATGSAVLQLCVNSIAAIASGLPALREAIYRDPKANVAGWRLLLGLLEGRTEGSVEAIAEDLARSDEATLQALRKKGRR